MKNRFDTRLVATMWATRRLIWVGWVALFFALAGLYEQGITFVSVAVFIAAIALSIAVAMVEIEREQPARDATWRDKDQ